MRGKSSKLLFSSAYSRSEDCPPPTAFHQIRTELLVGGHPCRRRCSGCPRQRGAVTTVPVQEISAVGRLTPTPSLRPFEAGDPLPTGPSVSQPRRRRVIACKGRKLVREIAAARGASARFAQSLVTLPVRGAPLATATHGKPPMGRVNAFVPAGHPRRILMCEVRAPTHAPALAQAATIRTSVEAALAAAYPPTGTRLTRDARSPCHRARDLHRRAVPCASPDCVLLEAVSYGRTSRRLEGIGLR
jgi:hypothetical protein